MTEAIATSFITVPRSIVTSTGLWKLLNGQTLARMYIFIIISLTEGCFKGTVFVYIYIYNVCMCVCVSYTAIL